MITGRLTRRYIADKVPAAKKGWKDVSLRGSSSHAPVAERNNAPNVMNNASSVMFGRFSLTCVYFFVTELIPTCGHLQTITSPGAWVCSYRAHREKMVKLPLVLLQTPVTKINYLEPRAFCHQGRSQHCILFRTAPRARCVCVCLHPSGPIPLKGWNLKDMIYGAPRTDWFVV